METAGVRDWALLQEDKSTTKAQHRSLLAPSNSSHREGKWRHISMAEREVNGPQASERERQRDIVNICNTNFGLRGQSGWENEKEQARAVGVNQGSACCSPVSPSLLLITGNKSRCLQCLREPQPAFTVFLKTQKSHLGPGPRPQRKELVIQLSLPFGSPEVLFYEGCGIYILICFSCSCFKSSSGLPSLGGP